MNRFGMTLAAMIFSATGAFADPYVVKNSSDGFLNVRSGPGTQYDVMREIRPGDRVESLERKGHWLRVRLPSGGTGWVSGRFLQKVAPSRGDIREVVQTSDGFLNLRRGPGVGNAVIQQLYPGNQVRVLGRSGNWLKVQILSGVQGWVHKNYITR